MVYVFARNAALLLFLATASVPGFGLDVSQREIEEVVNIGRAIHHVQPNLEEGKYLEFGLGILRAARQYEIEPLLLVAIANRETSFRENLPEGRAGEIGICQIRKMWLQNTTFRREFKKASMKELNKPSKNFLYAAWILRNLKDETKKGALPYWSFYNAMRFEPRLRYFLTVNKVLVALKKFEARRLASETRVAKKKVGISLLQPIAPTQLSSWQKPKQSLSDSRRQQLHDSTMIVAATELGEPERWLTVEE